MVRKHNKLKRIIIFAVVTLIITAAVSSAAYAHSGKTDSSGGHTDHSTGEYHYHHGYSAHQHTDMDGDGVLDCPYEFEDKTDHGSRSSTSSPKVYSTAPPVIEPSDEQTFFTPKPTKESEQIVSQEDYTSTAWAIAFGFVSVVLLTVAVVMIIDNRDLVKNVNKLESELSLAAQEKDRIKRFISAQQSKLTLHEITGAPVGKYITKSGYPIYTDGYFDEFSIYINPGSDAYHSYSCRYNTRGVEHNIKYTLYNKIYPCSFCHPKVDFKWVDACIEYEKLLSSLGLPNNYIEPKHQRRPLQVPVVEQKPVATESKPVISKQKTVIAEQKTVIAEQKTVIAEQKTVIAEQKTVVGEQKTAFAYPRTVGSEPQPVIADLIDYYNKAIEEAVAKSSCFSGINYSPARKELTLTFAKTGYRYMYFNISEKLFDEFIFSDSLGEYYNQRIKHIYPSTILY